MLVASYFAARRTHGKLAARRFLEGQLKKLEKAYGKGSDVRLKANMRKIATEELLEEV